MISKRLASTIATGFWVGGALLIGQALHVSVVTGEAAVTDPAPVVYALAGVLLLVVGSRLNVHPSEYLDYVGSDEEREGSTDAGAGGAGAGRDAEFDPEVSPLGEDLPDRDRDEPGRETGSGNRQE